MSSPRSVIEPLRHLDQPEDGLEQRRLAGTVRADDADQLAVVHVEVAAVEDVDAGHVAGDHLVGAQQRVLRGPLVRAPVLARDRVPFRGALGRLDPGPLLLACCVARLVGAGSLHAHLFSSCSARSRSSASSASARTFCSSSSVSGGVVVRAQVGVDDALVAHDGVRRALGDDLALRHHDDPVGDVADHVHVVLDEQHGHAVLAQVLDVAEQRLGQRRVHPGHRLVEHDHLGADHQRPGHLEQLALAAGQAAGEVLALGVELEAGEQARRPAR